MGLEQKIMTDMKDAMKAKDKVALRGIRAIKAALLLAKTDGTGDELTPEKEIKMLQKLVKQRKESLEVYEQQDREELAQTEREEIEVIERYLPTQLSEEELTEKIKAIIEEVGATSMKDMGKVMGAANQQLMGQADGKAVSAVVKKILG